MTKSVKKNCKQRVQISVDNRLLERMDRYAKINYMSRSELITISVLSYLNSYETKTLLEDEVRRWRGD